MTIADLVREAPFGQLVRFLTKDKYFQYPEEKPGFQLPECWVDLMNNPDLPLPSPNQERSLSADDTEHKRRPDIENPSPSNNNEKTESSEGGDEPTPLEQRTSRLSLRRTATSVSSRQFTSERLREEEIQALERTETIPIVPKRTRDGAILVDWYYSDDVANPHNWSNRKRAAVTTIICLYTFVVYTSSAIYTSSEPEIQRVFGVSKVKAALGLSLYVLGYGVGPLIFSPLSEIPIIGRNPIYMSTMWLFVILTIPTAFAQNYAGLMVLRFLTGFFGSPCLASGGASMGDMYSLISLPYALMAWVAAAYCGPALGPLLSGFAVPAKSWRWSLFESIWAAAPIAIVMFFFLPETSTPNLLLRRAKRLRKLTGNQRFMSQSEIDQRNMRFRHVLVDAIIKPMEITIKDPAVLFVQVYTAIIYGIYYSFFEVFPLVYPVYYGMNLGEIGLVFLCILVSCALGIAIYGGYLYFHQNPQIVRYGMPAQEARLIPALPASFGPTIGLFLFAWTSRASIHWIVPTIGITIYGATVFIVMQCIFVYIPLSYPQYAASLFAGNDFFRSALAAGSILFAEPLFHNLGVAKGTSLLGGLSVIGIIGIWLLYYYGATLRSRSKFAISSTETF
ncbi:major facilitator superfamily domain-containing protein [Emericellopsis atlantica]|uniref:Major facilitator superfamily domain-containing protein n=1 Tax=Emericellopsis atlantica TaxID=2614577 RepID=A0A9P8CRM3_9HYPO|nr:major facilitator superfamily domain-containing protein [Emericellopsis atlantica]KAG9256467.1 major facilitator superfamily domain-containing protein [Emericellopsis atlantica]